MQSLEERERIEGYRKIGCQLLRESREIALEYYWGGMCLGQGQADGESDYWHKKDRTPYTSADLLIEIHIREQLQERYFGHRIIGEEGHSEHLDLSYAGYSWLIDPIDGTTAFIYGAPTFTILLGLLYRGEPILGIIDIPILGGQLSGGKGIELVVERDGYSKGEITGGGKMDIRSLERAKIVTTSLDFFTLDERERWFNLASKVDIVRYSLDALSYVLLLLGKIDVVVESKLKAWDFLPIAALLEGSGVVCSDWYGKPLDYSHKTFSPVVSRNAEIHLQVIIALNS